MRRLLVLLCVLLAAAGLAGRASANITDPNQVVDVVGQALDTYWSDQLAQIGRTYQPPAAIEWYDSPVPTACGLSEPGNAMYCAGDGTIYLDSGLFEQLTVADGADYAAGAVLAHEWGHEIQDQLGILGWAVRHRYFKGVELQADCYAGLFSRYANDHGLLEPGDLQEAVALMTAVGDRAKLSPRTPGAHGTAKQRVAWFMRGYDTGSLAGCSAVYPALYKR